MAMLVDYSEVYQTGGSKQDCGEAMTTISVRMEAGKAGHDRRGMHPRALGGKDSVDP